MGKRFWLILVAVVVVLVGGFTLANRSSSEQSTTPPADVKTATSSDHVRGNPEAKVMLVEYGDFQCPACGSFYPIVKQLEEAYPSQLKVVFRHFPLSNIHPQAFSGARAAEAAGAQGKFWEMHDLLYEHQNDWTGSNTALAIFRDYARQLGLDIDKFNQDYNASSTSSRINADVQSGKNANVDATPSFYLNGQKLDPNPKGLDEFKAKIEELLNTSGA